MDKALMEQVLSLPAADRLDLMDRIWASLADNPELIPLPDEHRRILEARLRAHRTNPGEVVSWEAVRGRYLPKQ